MMRAVQAFSAAWNLAFSRPRVLLPAAVLLIFALLGLWMGTGWMAAAARPETADQINVFAVVLYSLASFLMIGWASAATILLVRQCVQDEDQELRTALSEGLRKTPAVLLLYLLLTLAVGVAAGIPAALVWLLLQRVPVALVVAMIGVAIWAIFLVIRLSLAEAALVLDGSGATEAVGSSWEASRGAFWSLLGLSILLALVSGAAELLGRIPSVGVYISLAGSAFMLYLGTAALALAYLGLRGNGFAGAGVSGTPPPPTHGFLATGSR